MHFKKINKLDHIIKTKLHELLHQKSTGAYIKGDLREMFIYNSNNFIY